MKSKANLWKPRLLASGVASAGLLAQNLIAQPTIVTQPASQAAPVGSNVIFTVVVSGGGPFAYQWLFNSTNLPNDRIKTVAGTFLSGFGGDGGAATNAKLNSPMGVAVDAAGSVYIADSVNNRIRKVDTNGIITTFAGNGVGIFAGDGGAATNASLSRPRALAFDNLGNLFIADSFHARVRRVDTTGLISTVAGTYGAGFSGDGGPATNANLNMPTGVAVDPSGNLFIADFNNNRVRKVDTNGIITTAAGTNVVGFSGDGGPAVLARLHEPEGVACDGSGDLFIADYLNTRIRKVDTTGLISSIVGTNTAGFWGDGGPATNAALSYPADVSLDPFGNLFIADQSNNRIRKVDINGIITTVAGKGAATYSGDGGPATNAAVNAPVGVALDGSGNLYIADSANNLIREVPFGGYPALTLTAVSTNAAGDYTVIVTSPGGSVTSLVATLAVGIPPSIITPPSDQAVPLGSNITFSVSAAGDAPFGYAWYFNGTSPLLDATNASLTLNNLTTNETGSYLVVVTNLYGAVTSTPAALVVALSPTILAQPASQTNWTGTTASLRVSVAGTGPFTYQWLFNNTNYANGLITTVAGNGTGGFSGDGGPATNASLNGPYRVAFDPAGSLYIADFYNKRIRKVDASGTITTFAGNGGSYSGDGGPATNAGFAGPDGLVFDTSGNLYCAGSWDLRVRKVDTNGIASTIAGTGVASFYGDGGPATNAALNFPDDVAFDGAGNLYIADDANQRIRKVNPSGIITTFAGNGQAAYSGDGGWATNASLDGPVGVAIDPSGNLFIADSYSNRVRKVNSKGVVSTFAGNGAATFAGDGGLATNASLNGPHGVALDVSGNLYIADGSNNRIRKVDANGIITTVAGNGSSGFSGDGGTATNASLGAPAGLTINTAGNLYVADTGNGQVRKVVLANAPFLNLNNVSLKDTGAYAVIIISAWGSVTSTFATLTVLVPPSISQVLPQTDGSVLLKLSGTPNSTNRVWVTTNLVPPVAWSALSTNVAGTDGTWQVIDANAAGFTARFYRASMP